MNTIKHNIIFNLSTCYISKETSYKLDKDLYPEAVKAVASYDYGWFLLIDWTEIEHATQDIRDIATMLKAIDRATGDDTEFFWVRLDSDGDDTVNLTRYDW